MQNENNSNTNNEDQNDKYVVVNEVADQGMLEEQQQLGAKIYHFDNKTMWTDDSGDSSYNAKSNYRSDDNSLPGIMPDMTTAAQEGYEQQQFRLKKRQHSQRPQQQDLQGQQPQHSATLMGRAAESKQRLSSSQIYLNSEDMRISKLLRRLLNESSAEVASELCEKLEFVVRSPKNTSFICNSADQILESMLQLLQQCPEQCLPQVSNILGLIGFINRNNFQDYRNFIKSTYQQFRILRKWIMLALQSTFICDVNSTLEMHSDRLLTLLTEFLENAEESEIFMAVSDTIVEFSKNYEKAFKKHFNDTVDIIVGWHLETDQSQTLKLHCANVLQKFSPYFLKEMDFTFGLLGQFLEDIVAFGEEKSQESSDAESPASSPKKLNSKKPDERVGSLMSAFNSIWKSLATPEEFFGLTAGAQIVKQALEVMVKAAESVLENYTFSNGYEETVLSINEFLTILNKYNYEGIDLGILERLIRLQFKTIRFFDGQQIASLFYLILSYVEHKRTALPMSFIALVFNTRENPLNDVKVMQDAQVYALLIKIYQEVLMLKSVPILQEVYKYIKGDLEISMSALARETEEMYETSANMINISFYLTGLSILATQTSSIIGMYALEPSILELLISNCKAGDYSAWRDHPVLYGALLQLLVVHCQKNHNFITTSSLLQEKRSSSPTTEHLSMILRFFRGFLGSKERNLELEAVHLNIILRWLHELLQDMSEHADKLLSNMDFLYVCRQLALYATTSPQECAQCLIALLAAYRKLPLEILSHYKDVAVNLMQSPKSDIREMYSTVLAYLPFDALVNGSSSLSTVGGEGGQQMSHLKHWYQSSAQFVPLNSRFFKECVNRLGATDKTEKKEDTLDCDDQFRQNVFVKSWLTLEGQHDNAQAFVKLCRRNRALVNFWLHNEMARYCVRNKLRTTIGKPQETFLAIEAIIMNYARRLSPCNSKGSAKEPVAAADEAAAHKGSLSVAEAMQIQENISSLLSFLDCLEKHIYNAGQGTAFAMPNAEKPAKAFFRINAQTCNEWFKRIRPAVNLIAIHAMTPEMVIRNSEYILKAELQQTNPSSTIVEHTLISLCWALLSRCEADSLTGLYAWLKPKLGKRYVWIQYAAEQAAGHFEQAATGYLSLFNESDNGTTRVEGAIKHFIVEQLLSCLYNTGQWEKFKSVQELAKEAESKSAKTEAFYCARSAAHLDTMQTLYNELSPFKNMPSFGYQHDYGMHFGSRQAPMMPAMSGALQQLMDWSLCSDFPMASDSVEKPMLCVDNYSYYNVLNRLEDACIAQTLQVNKAAGLSSEVVDHIRRGVQLAFRHDCGAIGADLRHTQAVEFVFLNNIAQKLKNQAGGELPLDAQLNGSGGNVPNALLTKCLLWSLLIEQRLLAVGCGDMSVSRANIPLYLNVAANARQHGNTKFASGILERLFALNGFHEPLEDIEINLESAHVFQINANDTELMRSFVELSKILYSNANGLSSGPQLRAINLLSALCSQIIEQNSLYAVQASASGSGPSAGTAADVLLCLADWLTGRSPNVVASSSSTAAFNASLASSSQLQALLQKLPEISIQMNDQELQDLIPANERAIGKVLNASVYQRNDSGAAWFAYGNWCYRWGKKLVEAKQAGGSDATPRGYLSERDMLEIKAVLENNVEDDIVAQLVKVLNSQQISSRDGLDEELDAHDISATEQIECELRAIPALANRPPEQLSGIIRVWRQAHKSVYAYYESAVRAYLKYLCIETASSVKKKNSGLSDVSAASSNSMEIEDCGFVTTTLRILRLVVKHAFALQENLEEALKTTPLRPWKVIIPQLFSRLNHHESYVRKSVSELLCRLAHEQPHSIIFPAVVGAQRESKLQFVAEQESRLSSESSKESNLTLSNCFSTLLATLASQSPETVAHVQLLVKELRRIALLWEEHWLHALTQLYSKYSPLFSALESEVKKSPDSEKLATRYTLLLKDVVADLQKIALTTNKEPETDYERNFQKHYQPLIDNTLADLNAAIEEAAKSSSASKPADSWVKIKQLFHSFQQRLAMRSATLQPHSTSTLRIQDLSPVLANMSDSAIAMPGVDTFQKQAIFIKRCDHVVNILPTKTKPKKLAFYGSDGRKYTFLFKGLEDLHLDERIMQFLSISNLMMSRTGDTKLTDANAFKANYYSVIPLGPQSGLISWVDGVTPIFSIYKRWQQRDAAVKQQQPKDSGHKDSPAATAAHASSLPVPVRPSELFYKKLTPLLNEQNLKLSDPRKQWPVATLRRVLDELAAETPRDLLAKELWCHATNIAEWRKSVRNYAISMAVMSVIGYVIGLGDRHLDNVLINLVTGEILHIDYNVCFEKGKSLRVPEKVPFRMTQNFEEALGLMGVEGTFRLSCEYVLRTLRKERETLLTLLEAFVYDPLVDWTTSDDNGHNHGGGGNNNNNNNNSTRALQSASNAGAVSGNGSTTKAGSKIDCDLALKVRIENMKGSWLTYVQNIESRLEILQDSVEALRKCFASVQAAEKERKNLNEQIAKIREVEVLGSAISSHSLNTITQRYSALKRDLKELESLKSGAVNALKDVQKLLVSYDENILYGHTQFTQMQQRIVERHEHEYENEFSIVHELLQRIKEEQLYADCDFARQEMDLTIRQETMGVLEFLKILLQYTQIMQLYPRSRLHKANQLYLYEQWYKKLCEEQVTVESLDSMRRHVEECLEERNRSHSGGDEQNDDAAYQSTKAAAIEYSQLMEKTWINLNFGLHEKIECLNKLSMLQEQHIPTATIVQQIQRFVGSPSSSCLDFTLSNDSFASQQLNNAALLYSSLELISEVNQLYARLADHCDQSALYEKMNLLKTVLALAQQAFPLPLDDKVHHELQRNHTSALQALYEMLFELNKLLLAYDLDYNDRLLRFFMYDDHWELQDCLEDICNAKNMRYIMPEGLAAKDDVLAALQGFLNEFYGSFEACEDRLQLLQKIAELIVAKNGLSFATPEIELTSFLQSHLLSINKCMLNEWKFQAVSGTFSMMKMFGKSLENSSKEHPYDVHKASLHIAKYVECWQSRYFNFMVKALVEAYHRNLMAIFHSGDTNIESLPVEVLNRAHLLCGNFVNNLQHDHLMRRQQDLVMVATNRVEHYTNVASAFYWANARYFKDSQLLLGHITYKDKLLASVQSIKQPLTAWKHTIAKIQDDILRYTELVRQRLEWVTSDDAVAHHSLASFNEQSRLQAERYDFFLNLAEVMLDHIEVLLNFETLMDDNPQNGRKMHREAETAFLSLLEQWRRTLTNYAQSEAQISPVETSIVELLDPEDKLDHYWISNVSVLLEEQTISLHRSLTDLEQERSTIESDLDAHGKELQALFENQLRNEMRQLLRSLSKTDRNQSSANASAISDAKLQASSIVREAQQSLKLFYKAFNELKNNLLTNEEYSEARLEELCTLSKELRELVRKNQDEVLLLMQRFIDQNERCESMHSNTPVRGTSPAATARNVGSGGGAGSGFKDNDKDSNNAADKKGNLVAQKRNAYAVSVWKRIRMKLEGRDPESGRRSSVAEQIDYIITEAMNRDNLAVLYEGWTPWV